MKHTLSSFIAWRYLFFTKKDRSISFMIRICFAGIAIGTFALMLTLIITNGFEKVIHEKMQGITSQVVINAPKNKIDLKLAPALLEQFPQFIQAASGSSIKQVIIDHNKQQSVVFMKGIEPTTEGLVSSIEQKIINPKNKSLSDLLIENHTIIGYKMARSNNLKIGDSIKLLIPEPSRKDKIFLKKKKAIIAGIFDVGLDEYDNNFAYCSHDFFNSLFKNEKGVDLIAVKLKSMRTCIFSSTFALSVVEWVRTCINNFFTSQEQHEIQTIKTLRKSLPGLQVQSWRDLYPALVSSLKLEKYVMFFILALISLVACMNMISLLFMQIQQKRRDIAIFKAMGMPSKLINRIFLYIGLSITFFASITGLGLAALAGFFLEKYPFIELPDVYYVSHLPARMDPEIFLIVFIATILLGFLATWIPAKRTKKINIVDVLRQE